MKENDDATRYLTGLFWNVYRVLADSLVPHIKVPRKNLPPESQLFVALVRLQLNLPFCYIRFQTGFSIGSLNKTFKNIINLMYLKLKFLVQWPDRSHIRETLPPVFKENFPRLTSIIDCFEVFIERPSKLKARAQVYSNYKKHSTVKFLLCCSPLGVVTFLSKAWGGRASDVQIVRSSGFISPKYHFPGDQILADRGFTLVDDFAVACSAELIIPQFTKGKKQLDARLPMSVEITRKIANVRIQVERVIGLLKNRYGILSQGPLPLNLVKSKKEEVSGGVPHIEKLVTVCSSLINLSPGIVYKET
ncbi:uncharacterized protein LOC135693391 isoform X2 [Rhopilema esculentum]